MDTNFSDFYTNHLTCIVVKPVSIKVYGKNKDAGYSAYLFSLINAFTAHSLDSISRI